MRLDHLSFAAGPGGLAATAERIGAQLGTRFVDGGVHPRFGTRNVLLPLADHTYLEVVEVLDHPASDKAPFGQAVRARSALGGGWLGWVVAVDDIAIPERRLGREAVVGNRHRPDGTELRWRQLGIKGLLAGQGITGFNPLHKDRRQLFDAARTGDGRPLPHHLKGRDPARDRADRIAPTPDRRC